MNEIVTNILANASAQAEENANFKFPPLKTCNYTAEFRPLQYEAKHSAFNKFPIKGKT